MLKLLSHLCLYSYFVTVDTEVPEAKEKDQFCHIFADVLKRNHTHDKGMVVGDFTARVGNVRSGFGSICGPPVTMDYVC